MAAERIPLQYREDLDDSQLEFYRYLDSSFATTWGKSFKIKDDKNRFIGPFGVTLATPSIGRPFYDLAKGLGRYSPLSAIVRETAILTVTAHFETKYATYAHEALALEAGMHQDDVGALRQGNCPSQATEDVELAFKVTSALVRKPGALSQTLWSAALEVFGREGAIALIHFIGFYSYTCVMLNGFDVDSPA